MERRKNCCTPLQTRVLCARSAWKMFPGSGKTKLSSQVCAALSCHCHVIIMSLSCYCHVIVSVAVCVFAFARGRFHLYTLFLYTPNDITHSLLLSSVRCPLPLYYSSILLFSCPPWQDLRAVNSPTAATPGHPPPPTRTRRSYSTGRDRPLPLRPGAAQWWHGPMPPTCD